MGQRSAGRSGKIFLILLVLAGTSCERAATPVARPAAHPTVASLVPAATDLLLGMHAGDHLVAVSNWDADRPEIAALPKVGDYRTVDWERLAQLRPDCMIVQFAPDKMPTGLDDRAKSLAINLVNVKINTLEDLRSTIIQLGAVVHEPEKAKVALADFNQRLMTVAGKSDRGHPVSALMLRSEPDNALACVGGGNYLDEILTLAGGSNVLAGGENSYPTIDREKLVELNPHCIFVLLPGASKQVIEQTNQFWNSLPQLSAVQNHRVYIMTESDLLLPGFGITRIARQFEEHLHAKQ